MSSLKRNVWAFFSSCICHNVTYCRHTSLTIFFCGATPDDIYIAHDALTYSNKKDAFFLFCLYDKSTCFVFMQTHVTNLLYSLHTSNLPTILEFDIFRKKIFQMKTCSFSIYTDKKISSQQL